MFVAAPGLIRDDLADQGQQAARRSSRPIAGSQAATPNDRRRRRPSPTAGEGLAARRALRDARIRGVAFAALGVLAFYFASTSFDTAAKFSFWIDKQGGESAILDDDGRAAVGRRRRRRPALVGILQLVRGAAFRWRPWLIVLSRPGSWRLLAELLAGKPANLTNVLGGSLELATPITLGAMAGILSERSGMFNIALEGKMLVGACVAVGRVERRLHRHGQLARWRRSSGSSCAMPASGSCRAPAGLARHPPQGGPDHRGHGHQHRRGRASRTSCSCASCSTNTQYNAPPTVEPMRLPFLSDIPVLGPILFSATAVRLRRLRPRDRRSPT